MLNPIILVSGALCPSAHPTSPSSFFAVLQPLFPPCPAERSQRGTGHCSDHQSHLRPRGGAQALSGERQGGVHEASAGQPGQAPASGHSLRLHPGEPRAWLGHMQTLAGWGESSAFPALGLSFLHGVQVCLSWPLGLVAGHRYLCSSPVPYSHLPAVGYPAPCPPGNVFCRIVALSGSP